MHDNLLSCVEAMITLMQEEVTFISQYLFNLIMTVMALKQNEETYQRVRTPEFHIISQKQICIVIFNEFFKYFITSDLSKKGSVRVVFLDFNLQLHMISFLDILLL